MVSASSIGRSRLRARWVACWLRVRSRSSGAISFVSAASSSQTTSKNTRRLRGATPAVTCSVPQSS